MKFMENALSAQTRAAGLVRVDWFSRTPARCAPSQEQKDACTAHYAQELETA
jgi:hypothetical protein